VHLCHRTRKLGRGCHWPSGGTQGCERLGCGGRTRCQEDPHLEEKEGVGPPLPSTGDGAERPSGVWSSGNSLRFSALLEIGHGRRRSNNQHNGLLATVVPGQWNNAKPRPMARSLEETSASGQASGRSVLFFWGRSRTLPQLIPGCRLTGLLRSVGQLGRGSSWVDETQQRGLTEATHVVKM